MRGRRRVPYEPRGHRNELQRQRLDLHQVISHSLKPQAVRLLRSPTCSLPLRKWVDRGYAGLTQTIHRVAGTRGLSPASRLAIQPTAGLSSQTFNIDRIDIGTYDEKHLYTIAIYYIYHHLAIIAQTCDSSSDEIIFFFLLL